jgi:hypothetical protein
MQYLMVVEKELVSYNNASPRFIKKELSNTRRRGEVSIFPAV